ncbi:chromosomal replication initiator protein DnaA [bacterium]|nr:chromosomal replication initiator protein DnaA [bacterium]
MNDYQRMWEKVLDLVRQTTDPMVFHAFFSSVQPVSFTDGLFSIQTNNPLTAEYVKKNLGTVIESSLSKEAQRKVTLQVIVKDDPEKEDVTPSFEEEQEVIPAPEAKAPRAQEPPKLNANYVFSNFIIGPSNQFAHAAAYDVAHNPGTSYNPLFIYGGSGLGKTHLLHAIGHAIYERDNSKRILYITCENFCSDFQASLSLRNNIHYFREKYRSNYDAILIDDIQHLSLVNKTQEEFFNLFEYLYSNKCQIVMTCDKSPKDLKNISERLITRFEWGVVADIQPPDFETRLAIIKNKCLSLGFDIGDDVGRFLAEKIQNHVREIEGVLTRLSIYASLQNQPISIKLAKECLKEYTSDQNISMDVIKRAVAAYFDISIADLTSKKRPKNIAKPRQLAMFLCRSMTNSSLNEIAASFGGKDHTTVLYACRKIEECKNTDDDLSSQIDTLKKYIIKNRREEVDH